MVLDQCWDAIVNKGGRINPIITTTVSMGIGSVLMLGIGYSMARTSTLELQKHWHHRFAGIR